MSQRWLPESTSLTSGFTAAGREGVPLRRRPELGLGLRRQGGGGMLPGQAMRLAVTRGTVSADGFYRFLPPRPAGARQVEEESPR